MSVLLVVMAVGAMGPPLLGPVREALQAAGGLSRAELGRWVFWLGTAGSAAGLALGVGMRRTLRTTFIRAGTFTLCLGCFVFALVRPSPGLPVLLLGMGWLVVSAGLPLVAASNGIFVDLWDASPHTGVILLHATNSVGKVLAPLAVILLGTALARSGLVYAVAFGLLAVTSLLWPAESVRHLEEVERAAERDRRLRLPRDPAVWLCVAQFAFIAGAEGGATAILGSLVERLRPVPAAWVSEAAWPAVVTVIMLGGIVAGRVVFTFLSTRLRERAIIGICLAAGLFALPAAFSAHPAVYLPCFFLTGVCFSATWPAFFALAARHYAAERTFLSFAAAFFNSLGISGCVYLASAIGDTDARLPHAFGASTAVIAAFAVYLYLIPWGRRLGATAARTPG